MSKKDIIKTLDIASFISAVVATILVVVFQFTGTYLVMKYSIVMYAVCFLTLAVVRAFRVYEVFSKKQTKEEDNTPEKNQKVWAIVWLSLAVIASIFTIVLLAIY